MIAIASSSDHIRRPNISASNFHVIHMWSRANCAHAHNCKTSIFLKSIFFATTPLLCEYWRMLLYSQSCSANSLVPRYHWATRDFAFAGARSINQHISVVKCFMCSYITDWDKLFLFSIIINLKPWICVPSITEFEIYISNHHRRRSRIMRMEVHSPSDSHAWVDFQTTKCSNLALPCKTLGTFVHSTLLQFTQLYEWVPGYNYCEI